jgi:hypothetical protein
MILTILKGIDIIWIAKKKKNWNDINVIINLKNYLCFRTSLSEIKNLSSTQHTNAIYTSRLLNKLSPIQQGMYYIKLLKLLLKLIVNLKL